MTEWIEAAARECTESTPLDTDNWQHFAKIIQRHYDQASRCCHCDYQSVPSIEIGDAELKPVLKSEVVIDAAELARLRKNSERWEWVASRSRATSLHMDCTAYYRLPQVYQRARSLDDAIDAAIAAEKVSTND